MAAAAQQPLVKIAEIPGRGRALIANQDIKPGEVLLSDSPLLLYSAAPTTDSPSSFCSFCFRTLLPSPPPLRCPTCPTCPIALFCAARCLSLAGDSTHSPWACQALACLRSLPPPLEPDLLAQAHFLIAAYSLPPSSAHLLALLESSSTSDENTPPALLPLLSHLPPNAGFSRDRTTSLLSVDKRNAFGLMEPFRDADANRGRVVRAYGIYPTASFFNHDCLPNACRFDDVERGADIAVRAIHDIPMGREVCLSYFPVNWSYAERQERLMVDYGFRCECDRCEVEKNWEEEEADIMEMGGEEEEEEGMEENGGGGGGGDGDFPHAYFFVRYLCDRENCGGTLAPPPPTPQGDVSDVMECNVCGRLRNEEDFEGEDGGDDGDGGMLDE